MEIFLIWLAFVALSLFFWAIGKRKGITNENEMPFLVKICYTIAQLPFGLIAIIFIVFGYIFGFILKIIFELLSFLFSKSEKEMASEKLKSLIEENNELRKENEELLNKKDLVLKKV
ncbi:TPA: hypothetical protein SHD59_000210 [Campylobacter coli]|nr:hypothetical protein [Campylobacter coli]